MKHIRYLIGKMGMDHREAVASDVRWRVAKYETDKKIVENMMGDVEWSLSSMLRNPHAFDPESDFLFLTYDYHDLLTSVSCSISTIDPDETKIDMSYRVGFRLWTHPEFRLSKYPTLAHIGPAMSAARQLGFKEVWTSFNEDRAALLRRIEQLKQDDAIQVRDVWRDWTVDPVMRDVNTVLQHVVRSPV